MPTLNEEARKGAGGEFVELSEGVTHYQLGGPDDGVPVVLIHGFSVPAFIWDPTFDALADAGFRVMRYDLFGRGYSDRPRGRYDLARFDRQLVELVSALQLGPAVAVLGLSMGGAIAVGAADRHPDLVRKLVLIDPAGMPSQMPSGFRILNIPLVGELLMVTVGKHMLVSGLQDGFLQARPDGRADEPLSRPIYGSDGLSRLSPGAALHDSLRSVGHDGRCLRTRR